MKLEIITVLLILLICVKSAKVHSRQYVHKRDSLKISKTFRSRVEVMENLFIIFDPSFLAYVWPKIRNGVHLNIGDTCWGDVSVFLKDLAEGRAWAYRAADASGRYQSGLFDGRRFWLGSKDQCLLLDENHKPKGNETWGEFYSGDYLNALLRREKEFGGNIEDWHILLQRDELMRRVVEADNEAPISLSYTALQIIMNVTKFTMPKSFEITLGLCLPRTCTAEDVVSIINFSIMLNDNLKSNKTLSRTIKINSLRHVESSYDIKTDIGAVSLILVTLSLVLLTIIATVVDFDLVKLRPYTQATSFDLQQYNNSEKKIVQEKKNNLAKAKSTIEQKFEADTVYMKNLNEFKKAMREKVMPPSVTLDVIAAEGKANCKRCGKYKRQCANPMQMENVPPCPRVKYNSCLSLATEFKKKNSIWKNLLLSFSLKHSWMRIFNTTMANKDLAVVHALKIFAVLWIIFVHVSVIVNTISENGSDVNLNNVYYIISSGTLAFDTLFFASGLISAQHFFYLKSRYSEELVNLGGVWGQSLQLLCFITNRAIRLLPPYIYALFLTSILSRVSRDTAVLLLPERDYDNCDSYWWRNLLYITNLYPREEQCMQVSWYLTAETQLHMFCALLCLLLAIKKRKAAAMLAATLLLGATAYDIVSAYSDFGHRGRTAFSLYSVLINRPWSRVSPYCAGTLAGWLLRAGGRGEGGLSRITSYCFWAATVVTLTASITLPLIDTSWISAWVHLTWPVALLWPVLVCATKYSDSTRRLLNSPAMAGLSRLCYGALLLHGAATRALLLAADAALCSRLTCLLCYFAGSTLVTLVAALCLSLLIEMPGCCLLRRISDYTYR